MHDISILSLVFTTVLALVCFFLILSPLFKWEAYLTFTANDQDLSVTKESLLTTLNELEFDYKMDKISPSDYKSLKKQYEEQVAILMKEEAQTADKQVDQDIMAEVEKEIEAQLKELKKKKGEGK
jgi:hypothetical protein